MSVASLLDATIRLYRRNFWTLVAIVAIVQVPVLVVDGILSVPLSQATDEMLAFSLSPLTRGPMIPRPRPNSLCRPALAATFSGWDSKSW
jgi:hypothetical protein